MFTPNRYLSRLLGAVAAAVATITLLSAVVSLGEPRRSRLMAQTAVSQPPPTSASAPKLVAPAD